MDASRNYYSWTQVDSTCLAQFIWWLDRNERSYLDVQFRKSGRYYRYHNVPEMILHGLMGASSRGQYFNRHIKPRFKFTRL